MKAKYSMIYNGIDFDRCKPNKQVNKAKVIIGKISRIARDKKVIDFILAAYKLTQKYGNKLEFHLVGEDSGRYYKDNCIAFAKQLGLTNLKFYPETRSIDLLNEWDIGLQPTSCFVPGTQIVMKDNIQNIENVKVGDKVMTHTGRMRSVLQTMKWDYKGKIYTIKTLGSNSISCTPEHPIYIYDSIYKEFTWKKAKDLELEDMLLYPIRKRNNNKIKYLVMAGKHMPNSQKETSSTRINLNKDFYRLLGYYLSEGCSTEDGIVFSFHTKEKIYHKEVIRLMQNVFHKTKYRIYHKDRNRTTIWFDSREISRFMSEYFGKGSHSKKIGRIIIDRWTLHTIELLKTLFYGDGHYNKKSDIYTLTTVSKDLAFDVKELLIKHGHLPFMKQFKRGEYIVGIRGHFFAKPKDINKKRGHFDRFGDDKYIYLTIKDIITNDYYGKIYNLEVEEDNSYTTESFAVHNSEGFGLVTAEMMAMKMPIVTYDSYANNEIVIHGQNGYVVPMDDIDQLVAYTEKLIADPTLRKSMAENGLQYVRKFNAEQMSAQYYTLYDTLIAEKQSEGQREL